MDLLYDLQDFTSVLALIIRDKNISVCSYKDSGLLVKLTMVEWKQTVRGDFFKIKLIQLPDVVFGSESNDRNFSSLAPPGGEKKWF